MTATVHTLRPHECAYRIFVDGVWLSASKCCYGQPLPIDPPTRKGRVA